ncbi:butyrate kinase [Desulforudis sp. 1088]|uniref:butyrate kinase n=1 Tax=unclassified Candidatus Desulforudis TaxID=2635950 RepID=UPI003CE59C1B
MRILVINPGSTSTKVAVYEGEKCVYKEVIVHRTWDADGKQGIISQYEERLQAITKVLNDHNFAVSDFDAIAARGGLLAPLTGGTYIINEAMYNDLYTCKYGEHASNLGGIMAFNLGRKYNIPAYTVDPVSIDEFEDLARFSGMPELPRVSVAHNLNMRAVGRKVAASLGGKFSDFNFIIVHLGSGISVAPFRRGRMIDVNNANNEGPFSLERCGTLPCVSLIKLCYSGAFTLNEMLAKATRRGGLFAYLGTKDFTQVEQMLARNEEKASTVVRAMCYQIAKEIGAMATVLYGNVDRIILTGGIAHSEYVVREITSRVAFIAPVVTVPGEEEMEALALGVLRVLRGEEQPLSYA